ncbi:hypothetical protein MRX96_024739 [Rhipicephalus microplus]
MDRADHLDEPSRLSRFSNRALRIVPATIYHAAVFCVSANASCRVERRLADKGSSPAMALLSRHERLVASSLPRSTPDLRTNGDITVTKPYVIPVSHVQRDPRSRDTSKRRVGLSHFVLTEKTLDPTLDDGDLTTRPTEITTRRTAT